MSKVSSITDFCRRKIAKLDDEHRNLVERGMHFEENGDEDAVNSVIDDIAVNYKKRRDLNKRIRRFERESIYNMPINTDWQYTIQPPSLEYPKNAKITFQRSE